MSGFENKWLKLLDASDENCPISCSLYSSTHKLHSHPLIHTKEKRYQLLTVDYQTQFNLCVRRGWNLIRLIRC